MGDLMLLGVLRAPTPEPDDVLGISQLADRARQAADRIEELEAALAKSCEEGREHLIQCPVATDRDCLRQENERLRAALDSIANKAPINPEYGNQGIDADRMMSMAREALAAFDNTRSKYKNALKELKDD